MPTTFRPYESDQMLLHTAPPDRISILARDMGGTSAAPGNTDSVPW